MYNIKNIRHFGSAATSCVEGNHHVLKSYIKLGRLHILEVVKRITLLWKNQLCNIHKEVERQKLAVSKRRNIPILKPLQKKVSHFALDLVLEQHLLLEKHKKLSRNVNDSTYCTGTLSGTFGVSCMHALRSLADALWRI